MRVLLTGGTGFIGSHTAVVLLEGGHDVFICDNLCNSQVSTLDAVEAICGRQLGVTMAAIRFPPKAGRI